MDKLVTKSMLNASTNSRPLISILIATRNERQNLNKTIDSLLKNTFYPNFEVLIMDDASNDGSTDFLTYPPYTNNERLILYQYNEQRGYAYRWNQGAQIARGQILKFLDAHHCFSPYWLTNLADAVHQYMNCAIVGPVVSVLDPITWRPTSAVSFGWKVDRSLYDCEHLLHSDILPGRRVHWFSGHQITVPTWLFEEVGGFFPLFRGHGTEDIEFCLRAFLFGYDCYVEPTSIIGHFFKENRINQVTWADVACNYLILVYLIYGEATFAKYKSTMITKFGYSEGLALFEKYSTEIRGFRGRIALCQRRSCQELLEQLAPEKAPQVND